jgi:hypothetical protein
LVLLFFFLLFISLLQLQGWGDGLDVAEYFRNALEKLDKGHESILTIRLKHSAKHRMCLVKLNDLKDLIGSVRHPKILGCIGIQVLEEGEAVELDTDRLLGFFLTFSKFGAMRKKAFFLYQFLKVEPDVISSLKLVLEEVDLGLFEENYAKLAAIVSETDNFEAFWNSIGSLLSHATSPYASLYAGDMASPESELLG